MENWIRWGGGIYGVGSVGSLENGITSEEFFEKRHFNITQENISSGAVVLSEVLFENYDSSSQMQYPDFYYSKEEKNKIKWQNVTGIYDLNYSNIVDVNDISEIGQGAAVYGSILPTSNESDQKDFNVWIYPLNSVAPNKESVENIKSFLQTYDSQKGTFKIDESEIDIKTSGTQIPCNSDGKSSATATQGTFSQSGSSYNFEIKSQDSNNTRWASGLYWMKISYTISAGQTTLFDDALFWITSEVPTLTEKGFAGSENQNSSYYRGYIPARTDNATTGSFTFSGTVTKADGKPLTDSQETSTSFYIQDTKGNKYAEADSGTDNGAGAISFTRNGEEYTITIPYKTDGTDDGEITYSLCACESNKTSIFQRVVVIDNIPPEITANISPITNAEDSDGNLVQGKYFVNGTINVSFQLIDDGQVESATYSINYADGGWSESATYASGTKIQIDTTSLAGGKNTGEEGQERVSLGDCIRLIVTDKAGNKVVYGSGADDEENISEECVLYNYIVNQQSDIPKIEIPDVDYTLTSIEQVGAGPDFDSNGNLKEHNIFSLSSSIAVRLEDDDGIRSLYVFIKKDGLQHGGIWTKLYEASEGYYPMSVTTKCPVEKLGYGRQSLRFLVVDKNYEGLEPNCGCGYYDFQTSPSSIQEAVDSSYNAVFLGEGFGCVDDRVPTLNVQNHDNENIQTSFTISGTAKDENGIAKIEFISQGSDGNEHAFYTLTSSDINSSNAWSLDYNLQEVLEMDDGSEIKKKVSPITIRATDGIGRRTESTLTYNSDSIPPERPKFVDYTDKIFYGAFLEDYTANTTNTLSILGSATDGENDSEYENPSGIESLRWALIKGSFEHTKLIVWAQNEGFYQCSATGENVLALINFLTGQGPQPEDTQIHTWNEDDGWYAQIQNGLWFYYSYENEDDILALADGSTSDENHEVAYTWNEVYPVNLRKSYEDAGVSHTAEEEGVDTFWLLSVSMSESGLISGEYTIVFQALDKVGNESKPLIYRIVADNDKPELTVGTTLENADSINTGTVYTSGELTLTGRVKDENPVTENQEASEMARSMGESYFNTAYSFAVTSKSPNFLENGTLDGSYNTLPIVGTFDEDGTLSEDAYQKRSWLGSDGNGEIWKWTYTFEEEGTYPVYIFMKDKAWWDGTFEKNSATLQRTVVVDKTKPVITIQNIEGQREYNGKSCVNGTIKINTVIGESYKEGAWYTTGAKEKYETENDIKVADEEGKFTWIAFTSSELAVGKSIEVDTTDENNYFTLQNDETKYLGVIIKTVDKAGNVTYLQESQIVDQNSDYPTVNNTNLTAKENLFEENGEKVAGFDANFNVYNVFTTVNNKIMLQLEDDDGLQSVQVKLDDGSYQLAQEFTGTRTSETFYYEVPISTLGYLSGNGRHSISFKISDINGKYIEYENVIAVDDGVPELSVNTTSEYIPLNFTLSGKCKDGNGISLVKVIFGDGESQVSEYTPPSISASEQDWQVSVTSNMLDSDGEGTMYVYAYDSIGNRSVKEISYKVDAVKPEFNLDDSYKVDVLPVDVSKETVSITGLLTDTETDDFPRVSGIKEIRYEITDSASHNAWSEDEGERGNLNTSTSSANYGKVFINADISEYSGIKYIHISGSDYAGNWSDVVTVKIALDSSEPTISVSPKPTNENEIYSIASDQVFTLEVSDDYALSSIKASFRDGKGGSDGKGLIANVDLTEDSENAEIPINNATKTITLPQGSDEIQGNRDIVFTVYDTCGKSVSFTATYQLDWTAPSVSFTNIQSDSDGVKTFFTDTTSSRIYAAIMYNDMVSGLDSLEYQFKYSVDDGVTWTDCTGTGGHGTITDYDGNTNGQENFSMGSFLSGEVGENVFATTDGLWELEIIATDKAGNSSTITSPKFWVDQNKPVASFITKLDSVQREGKLFTGNDALVGYIFDKDAGQVDKVELAISNANYSEEQKTLFKKTFAVSSNNSDDSSIGNLVLCQAGTDSNLGYPTSHNYYKFTWDLGEDSPFVVDGKYTITLTGYDEAGNISSATLTTACDNEPPVLEFTRPYAMTVSSTSTHTSSAVSSVKTGNDSDVTGSVTVAGAIPSSGEEGGMGEIYYQMGKANLVKLYDSEGTEIDFDSEQGLSNNSGSVTKISKVQFLEDSVYINNSVNFSKDYIQGYWIQNTSSNYNWSFDFNTVNIKDGGFADNRSEEPDSTATKWTTYFYMVAVDLAGNINFAVYPINIDTDTDKPQVEIQSPDLSEDNVFGGAFSVMGSASDDYGVHAVYMQVEVVNGNYDENGDLRSTVGNLLFPGDSTSEVENPSVLVENDGTYSETIDNAYFVNKNKWYKVKVNSIDKSSTTWKLKLNNKKVILDGTTGNMIESDSGTLRIFDNVALKNYYLSEYTSGGDYTESSQSEIIVRVRALDTKESGNPVLGGVESVNIKIDSGAPSIIIDEFPNADSYVKGTINYSITVSDDSEITDYSVIAAGSKTYTIKSKKSSQASSQSFTIEGSIDSKKLVEECGSNSIVVTITAIDETNSQSTLTRRFFVDNTAPEFTNAKIGNSVGNAYIIPDSAPSRTSSNRMMISSTEAIFNGWVKEESNGSGIDYVLLYFTRGSEENTRIYSAGKNTIDTEGIQYVGDAELVDESGNSVTVYLPVSSLDEINKNHRGITYDSSNRYASGTRTPYIVIDTVEANFDYSENGDKDGYNENLSSTGVWLSEFDSTMLSDGDYDIHYIVVDNAGNARHYLDSMRVINHAPEFTSVELNTYISGSRSLDENDSIRYITKRKGSSSTDSFDVYESELTDDTFFKSRNYLFSIKFNVNETNNGGLKYYLQIGDDESTKISSADTSESLAEKNITWDEENQTFTFTDESDYLRATGNTTFKLWIEDSLELVSEDYTLTVTMENEDTVHPIAQLWEFNTTEYQSFSSYATDLDASGSVDEDDWASYVLSALNTGSFDSSIGHIEPRNALLAPYKTYKPTLSGKVWIRGEVLDNQKISAIKFYIDGSDEENSVTIAQWSEYDSCLVVPDALSSQVELHQILSQEGHYAEFAYLWDTSSVEGVAKSDVKLTLVVIDGKNLSSSEKLYSDETGLSKNTRISKDARFTLEEGDGVVNGNWGYNSTAVDVAPYITKVTTSLSSLDVFNRTALGHYPVRSDETFTLYGFNLIGGTIEKAVVSANENDSTALDVVATGTVDDVDVKMPSDYLTVIVSEVESINNKNNNNLSVNKSASSINANLTDDVEIDVWEINSQAAKPAGGALTQPVMDINPVNGKVGFAFRNGALMMSMGSQDYSYDYWLCGLDVWTSIGFAYDDLGYGWGTAAGGDINSNSADSFALLSSRWGTGTLRNTDTGHNNGTNQIRPYTIGQKDFDDSGSAYVNIDKERFQSPSIATTVDGTASTVYLAYYDNINNEIRFHWGTFTTNTKTEKMVQDLFYDAYGRDNAINGKNIEADYAKYRLDYTSLLAGQTQNTHPYTGTSTDTRVFATDGTPVCAGEYVSISAIPNGGNSDDAVVAVWYDSENNQMLYSYNKTPKSILEGMYSQEDTGWSRPVAVFGAKNGIGEYCKVATDGKGGVHIAAYDGLYSDVWYAYIENFDNPSNAKACMVDSYGIIGSELDIEVGLDENDNPIPFISYYAASCARPKSAHWASSTSLNDVSSSNMSGAQKDMFTGNWEISVIPTSSKVSVDHTNIGVWKSIDEVTRGRIIESTLGESTTEQIGSSYKSTVSRGTIYGNGTANPILGYAIKKSATGYIETAQMR